MLTLGGFGNTIGAERNRIGMPVPPTERDYEMALNPEYYASVISKKYGIHLKGSGVKITIVYNPNLPIGNPGKVREAHPNIIELGPGAFLSESELANTNTIAHELNHARSFLRGGTAPEPRAYKSGNTLAAYIRGEK